MQRNPEERFSLWCWFVLLLLAPFLYTCGFCFPRGDDFDNATRAMFLFDVPGGFYEIGRAWLNWSGRFTFHFLAVFLGKAVELRPVYALVCAIVPFLAGVAVWGMARLAGPGMAQRDALLLGGLSWLMLLTCHQHLPTFYLQTDALTMGLQCTLTLCFVWLLCRVWQDAAAPQCSEIRLRHSHRRAAVVGIIAVGVYEHSAAAVNVAAFTALCLAWLDERLERRQARQKLLQRRRKALLCVSLFCLGALLFSFLAPGNFHRRAVRKVSAEVQWQQLGTAWNEWLDTAFCFFQGPWPLLLVLFVILLHMVSPTQESREHQNPPQAVLSILLIIIPPLVYLALSILLTVLHAGSDVTISESPKFAAGLSVYAALACGMSLWRLSLPLAPTLRKLPPMAILLVFTLVSAVSGNLPRLYASVAEGRLTALAAQMESREQWLYGLGNTAFGPEAAPRFGLAGEICRPHVRRRAIDPALPWAVVPRVPGVFPVWHETLPHSPEQWPNLWAAWLYGVGSLHAADMPPIRNTLSWQHIPLAPAPALRQAGISAAWLTRASADTSEEDRTFWLALRFSSSMPEHIIISEETDRPQRHYRSHDWRQGDICLLPMGMFRNTEKSYSLRLSLDGRDFHLLSLNESVLRIDITP